MKQKLLLLGLMLAAAFTVSAQEIKTYSSCDTNTDESVTISDVTNTANKVLGKAAAEQNVVTAEQLNTSFNTILEKLASIESRLDAIEEKLDMITDTHEYVDLGLSVKWATCNVGADNPHDYGLYFAWGETTGYTSDTSDGRSFDWASYKWMTSDQSSSKYVTKYTFADGVTSGCWYSDGTYVGTTVDGVTYKDLKELEASDDAATANWGGSWRMPTYAELTELMTGCYWEWTSSYNSTGVAGYIVYKAKSDSDKNVCKDSGSSTVTVGSYTTSDTHIFLPAAGIRVSSRLDAAGSLGFYWSSSLLSRYSGYSGYSYNAYTLYFDSGGVNWGFSDRYNGWSVRPVCP